MNRHVSHDVERWLLEELVTENSENECAHGASLHAGTDTVVRPVSRLLPMIGYVLVARKRFGTRTRDEDGEGGEGILSTLIATWDRNSVGKKRRERGRNYLPSCRYAMTVGQRFVACLSV